MWAARSTSVQDTHVNASRVVHPPQTSPPYESHGRVPPARRGVKAFGAALRQGRCFREEPLKLTSFRPPLPSHRARSAAGDSSPDEAPPIPVAVPMFPALLSPVPSHFPPHFVGFQGQRMLGATPEPLFYPGTSPPTPLPLPSLEAIQKGLMRSNSVGATQASRRLAMAKLTGGTETYDASPPPTPPPVPFSNRLGRNNTVAGHGGERIAARCNKHSLVKENGISRPTSTILP